MFRNLKKKTKKISIEKKSQNRKKISYPTFVFSLKILISPNLQIIVENNLHIQVDLKE